jgi:hypothetical protein
MIVVLSPAYFCEPRTIISPGKIESDTFNTIMSATVDSATPAPELPREIWTEIFDCFGDADVSAAMTLARANTDLYAMREGWLERANLHIINGEIPCRYRRIRIHGLYIIGPHSWERYDRGECLETIRSYHYWPENATSIASTLRYTRYYPQAVLRWYDHGASIEVKYRTYINIPPALNRRRDAMTEHNIIFDRAGKIIDMYGSPAADIREFVEKHMRDRSLLLEAVARSFAR